MYKSFFYLSVHKIRAQRCSALLSIKKCKANRGEEGSPFLCTRFILFYSILHPEKKSNALCAFTTASSEIFLSFLFPPSNPCFTLTMGGVHYKIKFGILFNFDFICIF